MISDQKICLKEFGKLKNLKFTAKFELLTYKFVVNALTLRAMLIGNKFGKEKKIILDFFVYFDSRHVTLWMCPKPP